MPGSWWELWQVANDVLNPKKQSDWKIVNKEGVEVTEELEVAESFNEFFVDKVNLLKSGIDPSLREDPFTKLQEKMKNNKCKLDGWQPCSKVPVIYFFECDNYFQIFKF